MSISNKPALWFPAVRTGTGTDVFTNCLVDKLRKLGLHAEITWLPLRTEFAPWTVPVPKPPGWANIVHVNTWLHPRFQPKNLPIVATLHHSVHHQALEPYKGRLRSAYHRHWIRSVERATMLRANRVVAVSHFAADSARKALLDRAIDVIPNGVDVERFRPPPEKRRLHSPVRLLYVGSWMARKGVDLLAPIMKDLGSGFELNYTGGAGTNAIRPAMPPNMHDIGRLEGPDAVVAAMHDADVFLFPSRSEGLPLSVIEAMACGMPVIATRGSAFAEVVNEGTTGILCRQDDVSDFVAAARGLACDVNSYDRLASASREAAVDRFSVDRMVDAYLGIYRGLAGL